MSLPDTPNQRLLAIQHVHFEHLGSLEAYFQSCGFAIKYQQAGLDDLSQINPLDYDLIVILGGPIGADDEVDYPFINDELAIIRKTLAANRPLLGFCLGAQLIAKALGAKVYAGNKIEIGWYSLEITPAGKNSPIRYLSGEITSMFHWHNDTFDLPENAVNLASSARCKHQIFSYQNSCLAFQCHPEFELKSIEAWLIGHACELSKHQININRLRQQSHQYANQLAKQTLQCLDDWLKNQMKAIQR
jgi:GMP synthase (glutamine-hydrolysing)